MNQITEKFGDSYRTEGYTIIRQMVSSEEISLILQRVDSLARALCGEGLKSDENPFLWLVRNDRKKAGHLFDCLIKIPEVNRILYSTRLQEIASALLNTKVSLTSPTQQNLRADHPTEEKFLYPWHTDYTYNVSSANSLVFWMPLQDVGLENGCLHVIPKSHICRTEIKYNETNIDKRNSAGFFSITNIDDILEANGEIRVPLSAGDALVFDARLIHKSGANTSKATRYALQSRWFDGLADDAIQGRWLGGIDEGRHPSEYL